MLQATRGVVSIEPLPSQLGGPTCFEDLFARRVLKVGRARARAARPRPGVRLPGDAALPGRDVARLGPARAAHGRGLRHVRGGEADPDVQAPGVAQAPYAPQQVPRRCFAPHPASTPGDDPPRVAPQVPRAM
eukprot:8140102-Alexandrium_andersonii.AAC.1